MSIESTLTAISSHLVERKQSLAVAESVTAGMIMAKLSLATNAIQFLHGGIVAYNLGQKARQLDVNPIAAEACNCVSLQTSQEMALNVARRFISDWGVGITGYAVPVPALKIRSPHAYLTIASNTGALFSFKIETKLSGQQRVQNHFTTVALQTLLKQLEIQED